MPFTLKPKQHRSGWPGRSIIDTSARDGTGGMHADLTRTVVGWCRFIFRFKNSSCHAFNMHEAIVLSECIV
jgi:hypothetical protein